MLAGPVKVATSPDDKLNCEKLWKRLFPRTEPIAAVTVKFGPDNAPLAPNFPSKTTCAGLMVLDAASTSTAKPTTTRRLSRAGQEIVIGLIRLMVGSFGFGGEVNFANVYLSLMNTYCDVPSCRITT